MHLSWESSMKISVFWSAIYVQLSKTTGFSNHLAKDEFTWKQKSSEIILLYDQVI